MNREQLAGAGEVVGVIATVVALVLAAGEFRQALSSDAIQDGPRTASVVVGIGAHHGRFQDVSLRYVDHDGVAHVEDLALPMGLGGSAQLGIATTVVYDKRHPDRAELLGQPTTDWDEIGSSGMPVALVALVALGASLRLRRSIPDATDLPTGPVVEAPARFTRVIS